MANWLNTTFYSFDKAIFVFAHEFLQVAGGFFTPFFKVITFLGNGGWAFLVMGVILLLFKKTRKAGLLTLLAIGCGALLTNVILKNAVARLRPYVADEQFRSFWIDAGGKVESEYSFPSGHATVTMASMMALFLSFNKKISWLALIFAFVMGFTRIYFVVHYTTDVLAGLVVGATAGLIGQYLCGLIFNAIEKSNNKACRFMLNADVTELFKKRK